MSDDLDNWKEVPASEVFNYKEKDAERREQLIAESNVDRETFELLCKAHRRDPLNPIGSCFDSAAHQIVFGDRTKTNEERTMLLHGIGVASVPGQKGQLITHAWVEFDSPDKQRVALDTTWGIPQLASQYRNSLQITYFIAYSPQEAFDLWKVHNYPGPWDERLIALQKKNGVHDR